MSRKLGQHFLINPETASRINRLISPETGEHILEVGPGKGFLTSFLTEGDARLTAVEIDSKYAGFMRERFSGKINVIEDDFLKVDLDELSPDKICGNLPYQISGKIIEKVLLSGVRWKRAVFMLPYAVAERVAAWPHRKSYSALSVLCAYAIERREINFRVPPEDFQPPPEIDSAVVSLDKKMHAPSENFCRIVKGVFRTRRKKVKNSIIKNFSLTPGLSSEILSETGIDERMRPHQLTPESFKMLEEAFVKFSVF